jgi:hypothetical protein
MNMALYRCYFMSSTSGVVRVHEIDARSDDEAACEARMLVARYPLCLAELWERGRLVRKRIWPSAPPRLSSREGIATGPGS